MRTYKPTVKGNGAQISKVIKELEKAKKPLICAGGGVLLSKGRYELLRFAEKHDGYLGYIYRTPGMRRYGR